MGDDERADINLTLGKLVGTVESLKEEFVEFRQDLKDLPCERSNTRMDDIQGALEGHLLLAEQESKGQYELAETLYKKRTFRLNLLMVFVAILALSNIGEKLLPILVEWVK